MGHTLTAMAHNKIDKEEAELDNQMSQQMATVIERQKREVMRVADQKKRRVARRSRDVRAEAEVMFASQGVEVDSGVAASLDKYSQRMAAEDLDVIRDAAWRESLGLQSQADALRFKGKMAKIVSKGRRRIRTIQAAGKDAADLIKVGHELHKSGAFEGSKTPSQSTGPKKYKIPQGVKDDLKSVVGGEKPFDINTIYRGAGYRHWKARWG